MVVRFSKLLMGGVCALILIFLLFFSSDVSCAVRDGLSICLNILVPSLFVFLILSDLFIKTGHLSQLLKPFGWFCGKLFHISSSLGPLLLMSLLCGYPVGARLIAALTKEKVMSKETGSRLLCFCVNAGPAFLIGSVAIPIFGSLQLGIVLFCSNIAAFFAVGIISGIGKKAEPLSLSNQTLNFSDALVSSVKSSTNAMVNICSFVLLFSGILGLLQQIGFFQLLETVSAPFLPSETASAFVTGMLEVSNGIVLCKQVPGALSFFLTVLITSFGGFCVHLQIRAILSKTGISMKLFYRYRILYLIVSFITSLLLFQFQEESVSVFSTNTTITAVAGHGSPAASILLLVFSVFLLCCDKKSVTIEKKHFLQKGSPS